jgi:hypothetical protein
MLPTDEQFIEAGKHWDLDALYADLASAKGKRLTPVEKLHLRGLLCGCSPGEIAQRLGKNAKGVETDLCATLYRYVKGLVSKTNCKVENWRNITEWLEEAGYKTNSVESFAVNNLLPDKSMVNITNINIENNQLFIAFNLRIPISENSDKASEIDPRI